MTVEIIGDLGIEVSDDNILTNVEGWAAQYTTLQDYVDSRISKIEVTNSQGELKDTYYDIKTGTKIELSADDTVTFFLVHFHFIFVNMHFAFSNLNCRFEIYQARFGLIVLARLAPEDFIDS